jgi:Uncharacterized flavoproteins
MKNITIQERIYYVGVNDRKKHLFENNWPLPYGVSYNSYLISDKKSALIDTIEYGSDPDYLDNIQCILGDRPLDYLVVNHVEPDHSGMINSVLNRFPSAMVIGNAQTYKMLNKFYNLPENKFLEIKDGEVIDLGVYKLQFALVPWVHWPETMVTYEQVTGTLFSCDAFGSFGTLDGSIFDGDNNFELHFLDEMRRYYSNIVGKYSNMVQKALKKLSGIKINMIAPSHGLIWRDNIGKVVECYDNWSSYKSEKGVVIVYASMYGNTEKMADTIGRMLGEKGILVRTFDVSKTHVSYLLSEIWKYKGFVLGTCAYNNEMHPMMEHLCNEIKLIAPKDKVVSVFGSSGWNGAGVKSLTKNLEAQGFELVGPKYEICGNPTECNEANCKCNSQLKSLENLNEMVDAIAKEINK